MKPCIAIVPFFNGTVEEGRKEFKDFLDLGMFIYESYLIS